MFLEAGWQHRIIRCALRVRQIKLLDRFLAFGSDFSLLLRLGVVFRFSRFISIIICAVGQDVLRRLVVIRFRLELLQLRVLVDQVLRFKVGRKAFDDIVRCLQSFRLRLLFWVRLGSFFLQLSKLTGQPPDLVDLRLYQS